ncbi:cholinesterase 1-like isoform X1 [Eriocheir sinensis]|uniref:cholinesterase 1-like isoform X1 n=2 Tax=Eriocheir sinensis TaxID=95602 RepID=UPI0021CA1D2F|nr:cholinesterase 1-like isoform X1 [Eriocheir sinensis]
MMITALVLVAMAALAAAQPVTEQADVRVTLQQGDILGSRVVATNGRPYYTFRSIPYANPPVGPLRFKDPEPAPAWSGVRNGSMPIPKCPQYNLLSPGVVMGQEDCLYLNVYTPKLNSSKLPVMVRIHGGGFILGSAEDATPEPLMQKDVVVVSINYRLGALALLSTGDDVLPGNLFLKDQTLALRWVQDNIRDLGGDPQQVTIFGISAGGISVHLHVLSPRSAGLFQRAIIQSGTALSPGLFSPPREGAILFSKELNCTGEESQKLLACFNEARVEDLVKTSSRLSEWYDIQMKIGLTVDGVFLPDHPAALHKAGRINKVHVIAGATQDDGNVFSEGLLGKYGEEALQQLNENFTKAGPILLGLEHEENPVYLARRIFFNYMDDLHVTREKEFAFTRLLGEAYFNAPNAQMVEFLVPHTKTYMYQFDHCPPKSLMQVGMNVTQTREMAGHADDMLYLFQLPPEKAALTPKRPQDLHMQEILVDLWTNFASTGNPTINGTLGFRWPALTPGKPLQYLSLTTTPTMWPLECMNQDFWNSLPTKNNKMLYPERFLEDCNPSR